MEQTLLLNSSYEPLKVIDWQKAITLFYKGRVEVLREHDRVVHSVSFEFKLPSVVRLFKFVKVRRTTVPFTRANIYARDQHTCQYCGDKRKGEDLTFDHVIPVTQGGTKGWSNIVTACVDCNTKKGGRTPQQAGMRLLKAPVQPSAVPLLRLKIGLKSTPESWRDWLYFNVELDET